MGAKNLTSENLREKMGAKKLTSENLREKNGSQKTHLRKSKGKKMGAKKLTSENLREKMGAKKLTSENLREKMPAKKLTKLKEIMQAIKKNLYFFVFIFYRAKVFRKPVSQAHSQFFSELATVGKMMQISLLAKSWRSGGVKKRPPPIMKKHLFLDDLFL